MWWLINEGVSRTVLYVSLGYNIGAWAVAARDWYNYIDDYVILGALPFAFMKQKLVEEEKVGAVISLNMPYERQFLTTPTDEWEALGVTHLKIDIPDFISTPSVAHLWEGVRLMKEKRSGGFKTYVHCKAGRSRSATMVTAYVMLTYNKTVKEAVDFVTEKRPHVKYSELQLQTLKEFEKTLPDTGSGSCNGNGIHSEYESHDKARD